MHTSIRFLVLGFVLITIGSRSILAQVPTPDSDAELRIKQLEKQADSLKKAARHLKDSLHAKIHNKDFGKLFFNCDSLLDKFRVFSMDDKGNFLFDGDSAHFSFHVPDSLSFRRWTDKFPKNYHYEIPDLPDQRFFGRMPNDKLHLVPDPGKEKKKTPIDRFKGWYIEELAELGE